MDMESSILSERGSIAPMLRYVLLMIIVILFVLVASGSAGSISHVKKMELETTTDEIASIMDLSAAFPEETKVRKDLPWSAKFTFRKDYIYVEGTVINHNHSAFHTSEVDEEIKNERFSSLKIKNGKIVET